MMRQITRVAMACMMVMLFACHSTAKSKKGAKARAKAAKQVKQPKPALKHVFQATHAGTWYPGDKKALQTMLHGFFDKAAPRADAQSRLVALIEPHAGYVYSGQTAAFGYKLLKQRGKNVHVVVVMGPSHTVAFHGVAVPDWDGFKTPLGTVPVATKIVARLKKQAPFRVFDAAFAREHSVEMQIPLLQFALGKFKLVPLVVGGLDRNMIQQAAKALRPLLDRPDVLFVVSSDFTHYGPRYGYTPFTDQRAQHLKALADQALNAIEHLDLKGFIQHRSTTGDTICGFFPITILLAMLPHDTRVVPLHFDTSGRITNDYTNSVSYFSIAFFKKQSTGGGMIEQKKFLNKNEEIGLLRLSRQTLRNLLAGKALPDPKDPKFGLADSKEVFKKYGVFVTLNEHKRLRGCIGNIFPVWPLAEGVVRNTVNAAKHDPRFRPVLPSEEPDITIEISVLTVPREVPSYKDVKIGRDGVVISKGGHRAVYLPQVAPEQGWNIEQTLDHLCIKAGLPMSAWREPGMQFMTFQAQVFSEED